MGLSILECLGPIMPPYPESSSSGSVAPVAQPSELPGLHREIEAASGATASVVLERARRSGEYAATSIHGFPEVSGAWLLPAEAAILESCVATGPAHCDLRAVPTLARRVGAESALVVPLAVGAEPAYLVVACPPLPAARVLEIGRRAHVEFGLALQLARYGRQAALHQRLQELFLGFSRGISATLSLRSALESVAVETNTLFGCRRTSIWLHNRRARELTLMASSDTGHAEPPVTSDSHTPAARGMRLDRPHIEIGDGGPMLLAPLRGWRRALGTIVIEGGAAALDDHEFSDAAYEVARQLSVSVENVQLLEEVLQQRRLLEDTFNSLIDLVVVTDNAMRVVQMNEAFALRVGTARSALLQRPLDEMIGPELAAWLDDAEVRRASDGSVGSGSSPARGARTRQFTDERLAGIFAATVTPLINQDGNPVGQVLVIRDITVQTRLEQEQAALRERLAQSEKLASLGQFVAGIAHEMNNPLQGVLGHLELLLTTNEAAKPVRPTLRRIYQEGDRAAKIVRNLLVFAGSRRMTRRKLRVQSVISRALASRGAALRRHGITVTRHTAEDTPPVSGDPLLLQQAFLNILINAEHAIAGAAAAGRIEITTGPGGGGVVRTTIRDTGSGIPADILPRIFDPFFTTKDVGQGTGLGLAITYGIIQEHGGTIQAQNAAGGGAIMTIDLPAATQTRSDTVGV